MESLEHTTGKRKARGGGETALLRFPLLMFFGKAKNEARKKKSRQSRNML